MSAVRSLPVIITAAVFAATASANQITNGSFESGLTNWSFSNPNAGATYGLATDTAHTGSNSAHFGPAAGPSSLTQSIALPAGDYELSFWVLNYGVDNDLLHVTASDGINSSTIYGGGMVLTGLESWELVTQPFSLATPASSITFAGFDNNAAFYIDDISLTAIPSPASLVPAALAAALLRRRR